MILFIVLLITETSVVNAQRPAACGEACDPTRNTCRSSTYCHPTLRTCYEFSCDPTKGHPACCKSNRPARPNPTTPPGGGNPNPAVPTGSVVDPGPVNPTGGTNTTPAKLPPISVTPPAGGGGTTGDCSGPTEGTKDGKVDLADFNLLRKELSGTASSKFCDNDTNGVVDLLDFNIFRIAFIAQK